MKAIKIIGFSIFLIFLDLMLKYYTVKNIAPMSFILPFYPYGGIGIFKDFFGISLSLNFVKNSGAAFGLFKDYSNYLFYFRILIASSILFYIFFKKLSFKRAFSFILILSGAIGNILDYFFYGYVVDMIHFTFGSYSYPVFNLADCYITLGIIFLIFTKKICK